MGLILGNFDSRLIDGLTIREFNFICRVIRINPNKELKDMSIVDAFNANPSLFTNRVSHSLPQEISDDAISRLIKIAKFECIDNNFFDWIDINNHRQCNYIWSFIRCLKTNNFKKILMISVDIGKDDIIRPSEGYAEFEQHLYIGLMLESLPKNNKEKKDCFIAFIDLLNLEPHDKKELLNKIKLKWVRGSEKRDVVNWVSKDNQSWAWNYLHDNKNPVWFIDTNLSTSLQDGIITTFDLLMDVPDTRELLFKKMKLAWSQKTYRDKDNGKKSVNIVLSEDIIKKLDSICVMTDRRKNEVMTRLIREEYDKVKKSGQ